MSCHPHNRINPTHKTLFISSPYQFWHTNT